MPLEPWRQRAPRDGKDGKDADIGVVRQVVDEEVRRVMADMPRPRNGRDADPAEIRAQVAKAVASIKLPEVKDGERGPRGFEGLIGPMPRHEWKDTSLRFEEEPGVWGKWVDLQGPKGDQGFGGVVVQQGGTSGPVNSYFPAGWG